MSSVKDVIDKVSRESGLGNLTSAATNNLWGINHRLIGNPIPANKDHYGLTFFTRPRLNLSYDNIAVSRVLTPLLDGQGNAINTYQRAIRVLLDPDGADGIMNGDGRMIINPVTTPLIDNQQAFIPFLTNNLISMTGWPDPTVETYTSKQGNYKEAWSMVDSSVRIFETFDITASFRNIEGDPITLLFNTWLHYMSGVYEGTMVPYPEMIVENEIDYNTRIYRIILDQTGQTVQKIGACGAAFPLNTTLGAAFNFSNDQVFNQDNGQISISFRCMGADYLDPILIEEFNNVVCQFNLSMLDAARPSVYIKLSVEELKTFNYRGYPRIDPNTFEMEWWVPQDVYTQSKGTRDINTAMREQASAARTSRR